nr:hypothetical protein [Tanacetum cinerariifolium]GEV81921.1 hypothetical protein [Tanacetum cinerariifolium]
MVNQSSMLNNINALKDTLSVKAKVVCLWRHYYYGSDTLEGESVHLSNFYVAKNNGPYKVNDHPSKINLHKKTKVKAIQSVFTSKYGFTFVPFTDFVEHIVKEEQVVASPRVRRRRERVVGFKEIENKGESRVERNNGGGRPSEEAPRGNGSQNTFSNNVGGNLPPKAHRLPFTNSDEKPLYRGSFANLPQGGHVPSTFTNSNILPQNGIMHPTNIPSNSYPFYTQPMYTFPNMPTYANPNSTDLFPNPLGLLTPCVCWIEDYPLPDGLKMPFHIGSYDGKGDPDNFLHLFEGAIRMQK